MLREALCSRRCFLQLAMRESRFKSPDLLDDMLHVLQSIHSDVYVTAEFKQSEYAGLLLTPKTKVTIYDRNTPIDEYLKGLA